MPVGITIVGLGPGSVDQLTLEAWRVLGRASEVYLRTAQHPTVPDLPQGAVYHSLDEVYEQHDDFAAVYDDIATRILTLGQRPEGVIYAVPGHPLVGETTVMLIRERAQELGVPVTMVEGLSCIEPTLTALGRDAFDGLQICDATLLARRHHPPLDPDVGALVVQIYSRTMAADVKLTLMNLYHDDHPVWLVRSAGLAEQDVRQIPLYALDRQDDLDHLTSAYLPPLAQPGSLSSYQDVMARLRAPDGCPWDGEQTHQSLRTHLLEETYEVLAALDADDMGDLKEELGDLLLQILFHAQIAVEDGDFKLIDTIQHVIEKLVRRHPHVFGQAQVSDAGEVLLNWEQIKREEKRQKGEDKDEQAFVSMLSGINKALPALSRAMEVQRRVARVGFDWPDLAPVRAKVAEELAEFEAAQSETEKMAEFGDLIFALVNLGRWHKIDPESAVREAIDRFERRFEAIERHAAEHATVLEAMTLEQMDAVWEQAKTQERPLLRPQKPAQERHSQ